MRSPAGPLRRWTSGKKRGAFATQKMEVEWHWNEEFVFWKVLELWNKQGKLRPKRHDLNSIKTHEILPTGELHQKSSTKKHRALINQKWSCKQQTRNVSPANEIKYIMLGRSRFEIGEPKTCHELYVPWVGRSWTALRVHQPLGQHVNITSFWCVLPPTHGRFFWPIISMERINM